MPDQPIVDLAMTIPSMRDGQVFVELADLGDLLTKSMMPDRRLDLLEKIIIKNWQVASSARVRMEWALEYIRKHELWKTRRVQNEHGETVAEFDTFIKYAQWLYSQVTKISDRAINYRLANVRIAQSLGFELDETVALLDDPSNVQQVARLFETDHLSRFEGFASPQVEEQLRAMVGDDGTASAQEVAKQAAEMLLTEESNVSAKVDAILHAGEERHKWEWNGKHLQFVVYVVGQRERTVVKFIPEGKIPGIALEHLEKYGRR